MADDAPGTPPAAKPDDRAGKPPAGAPAGTPPAGAPPAGPPAAPPAGSPPAGTPPAGPPAGGPPAGTPPADAKPAEKKPRVDLDVKDPKRVQKEGMGDKDEEKVIHTRQLDKRMRHGDAEATPRDKKLKGALDGLVFLALGLVVFVVVASLGIFSVDIAILTYIETATAAVLMGASFVFTQIDWRAMRGSHGAKILEKWKADFQLTVVSILALFTVVFILIIEVLALLAFIGVIDPGEAGAQFAGRFILFAAMILLVQVMAFVVREYNLSSYQPHPRAVLASNILTPVAGVFMFFGALLATNLLQSNGIMAEIAVRQAIYVVIVGVGLEFLAMRIRLRLPSVWSLFMAAIETSKKANEEMRIELQKRAMRTYVAAVVFVALGMAGAGAMVTGAISVPSQRIGVALGILYGGLTLIIIGLVVLRVMQRKHLNRASIEDADELSRLVGQKRRNPKEIARLGIIAFGGFLAVIFFAASVTLFVTSEEIPVEVPVLDDDGEPLIEDGEPVFTIQPESRSMFNIKTTYATDVMILAIVSIAGPVGYFFNADLKRIEAIDDKFPDFLRDLAESSRAGMTLPRALVTAAGGTYGALTPEIKQMAAQVEWGVEFGEALERFAERAKTPLIDRTVALVVEAQRAGGNVIDILTAASDDAREIKQIIAERTEQMKMYNVVVFIAFFVFITVVLILSAQFLPAFKEAVDAATQGGQPQEVGGIKLAPFDIQKFNDIFFHAALIQAVGGSLVGGVMTKGNPVAGFNSMFVMMAAAWLAFRVGLGLMA